MGAPLAPRRLRGDGRPVPGPLLAWAVGVAQRERNDGRCDPEDAKRIVKPILRLRASLAVGYHRLGQPMPFVYVHLVRILTTCYLPVFAFVLARLGSRNPAVHTLACVAICITCFFFLGINTVSVKLADPYGHDIDDLRIIAHCSAMPACRPSSRPAWRKRPRGPSGRRRRHRPSTTPWPRRLLVPLRGGRRGQPDAPPGARPRRAEQPGGQGASRCITCPSSCASTRSSSSRTRTAMHRGPADHRPLLGDVDVTVLDRPGGDRAALWGETPRVADSRGVPLRGAPLLHNPAPPARAKQNRGRQTGRPRAAIFQSSMLRSPVQSHVPRLPAGDLGPRRRVCIGTGRAFSR